MIPSRSVRVQNLSKGLLPKKELVEKVDLYIFFNRKNVRDEFFVKISYSFTLSM